MYQFIHSPMEVGLDYFWFGKMMNKDAIHVKTFVWI